MWPAAEDVAGGAAEPGYTQRKYIHHHLVGVVGRPTARETPGEVDMDTFPAPRGPETYNPENQYPPNNKTTPGFLLLYSGFSGIGVGDPTQASHVYKIAALVRSSEGRPRHAWRFLSAELARLRSEPAVLSR